MESIVGSLFLYLICKGFGSKEVVNNSSLVLED